MSDHDYMMEKITLSDGWVEVRIVAKRPLLTPDFKHAGNVARASIAKFQLAGAAGVCHRFGRHELEAALAQVWALASQAFGVDDAVIEGVQVQAPDTPEDTKH